MIPLKNVCYFVNDCSMLIIYNEYKFIRFSRVGINIELKKVIFIYRNIHFSIIKIQ